MRKNFVYLTILILIFLIFKNYSIVLTSSINAVELWLYKVFPYLFIMIVINDTLINLGFEKVFKNNSIYAFVMSLLSGSPTSAVIIGSLFKQGKMSKENANITLMFTYFANPLFLYTMLNAIFGNTNITIKLMLIHYLSNIIIYIIFHKKLEKSQNNSLKTIINISSSIKKAMNTTIMVLGTITFYLVISNILNLPLLIRGLVEITQGLNLLITTSLPFKEIITMLFISFGGISIHTQIKCILDETDLEYTYFLKGRIYQTLIACIITLAT